MNIKLRPLQRTNGDVTTPKWEADDAEDALADKLAAHDDIRTADAIPVLPPMAAPKPQPAVKPHQTTAKPKETVNVRELMETLLEAWTNPSVRMWVDGNDLCFEQVDEKERTKNTWYVGFSHVRTNTVRLIK